MISREYMERLGLTEDQITLLSEAMKKESRYRQLLTQERVSPTIIEDIMRNEDLEKVDFSNEELVREKIRVEYDDMIPRQYKKVEGSNVQIWANRRQYQK